MADRISALKSYIPSARTLSTYLSSSSSRNSFTTKLEGYLDKVEKNDPYRDYRVAQELSDKVTISSSYLAGSNPAQLNKYAGYLSGLDSTSQRARFVNNVESGLTDVQKVIDLYAQSTTTVATQSQQGSSSPAPKTTRNRLIILIPNQQLLLSPAPWSQNQSEKLPNPGQPSSSAYSKSTR